MSSLTHGLSGLVMGYATVAIPMAVTMFRRTADYAKALASSVVAVPVTIGAGIATAVAMPLIHGLGIERGSFLELAAGVGICAGIGYAAGRALARPAQPTNVHQRGTVIKTAPTRAAPAHTASENGASAHAGATRSAFMSGASTHTGAARSAFVGEASTHAGATRSGVAGEAATHTGATRSAFAGEAATLAESLRSAAASAGSILAESLRSAVANAAPGYARFIRSIFGNTLADRGGSSHVTSAGSASAGSTSASSASRSSASASSADTSWASTRTGSAHTSWAARDQSTTSHSRRNVAQSNASEITLAGLRVAPLDETKHFKIIGTTGTGKSTAIRELLAGALDRGDRAIIADPDGGYMSRFRDPARGDIILNPFEPESRKWDLFGEIRNPYDIDQLSRSLLPDQGGPDRSWINYARTFFSSVTRQTHEAGITDMRELYRLLVVADAKELRGLLAGTPAQPFLEEHNGRMFDSIRSVTSSAVGSLDYVAQQSAGPLSIRQWVRREDNESGVLFIPYKAGQIASLRSTISAWMRLAIFEAMNQPEGDQHLWFVVDELDALGQIDGLKDALARLRKFGGRTILGFQSIAQVSGTYGTADAQTITENCGNTLILRCSGSDHGGTANFASRLIGQREVLHINKSRSRRPGELLSSITLSEHVGIEPAVMDSEIEQLPDLAGYLKFASVPNWQQVTLPAPAAPDSGQTREEARSNWQRWRADHAADVVTPRANAEAEYASATSTTSMPESSAEVGPSRPGVAGSAVVDANRVHAVSAEVASTGRAEAASTGRVEAASTGRVEAASIVSAEVASTGRVEAASTGSGEAASTDRADAVSTGRAEADNTGWTEVSNSARMSRTAAAAAGAARATKRAIAARATIDYGPVMTPDGAEYE